MTTVRVWWASLRGDLLDERLLDPVELGRAAAFRREADRRRFVLGALMVRHALARDLGVPPAEVPVDRRCATCGGPHGPPRSPGSRLRLSVTHAGDAVGVAAALDLPVGVDVEPLAGLDDARRLAADVLTRVELSRLAGVSRLDEAVFVRGFAERWVAKEAILKATGDGLRLPMAGLELGGDRAPYRLVGWAERPDVVRRVSLHRLDEAPAGHVACLAVLGGASRPEVEELPAADLLAPRVGA